MNLEYLSIYLCLHPTLPPPLLPSLPSPLAPFLGSLLFSMPPSFAHSVSKHWLFFPCLGFTGEVARQDGAYSCYFGAGFSEVSLVPLQQTHTRTHTHTHTRARAQDRKWSFQTVCSAFARQTSDFSVVASKNH